MNDVEIPDAVLLRGDPDLSALISACAEGNHQALEKLYKATSPYVFAVLRRILRTEALAEEALQETFIKIWGNANQYTASRSAPKTWLVSIARNHAIDVLRRRRTREDVELNLDNDAIDIMPSYEPSIETEIETTQLLDRCLEELSEPARECVVRAYCEGFSADELSDKLERPLGTVKSWIRRSLISLRECLDGYA